MKQIRNIGQFFANFAKDLIQGDIFVKLSLICMGAGYFRRKHIIKGIIMTVFQIAVVVFALMVAVPYLAKFTTLGTVQREMVFNIDTMKNEVNNYDHSFKILLYGLVSIAVLVSSFFVYLSNISRVRKLQVMAENGKHINTFAEDMKSFVNEKFHITLLFFPVVGIILLTVIPLLVLILVAFTNYDQTNMPPTSLFTWVGVSNFKRLFESSISVTFGYSFKKVLAWTLTWAFFATFTTYFGGILLAMFINNKKTKAKRLWRTLFIVAIAVPQFVTLLLVRNFFADTGIVNTIFANAGITDFLKMIGLVQSNISYIPFLTDPNWAKFMIILINIWIGIPYLMLIATGVLMNIPADLMESARIDGANSFQIFRKITMPYVFFVTGPYLVSSFVLNINNFNVIYLLTQDVYVTLDQALANSQAKEIDLLVTWLYRLTQEYYNFKMASVIGIMVFVICAVFTLIAFNFMIRGDKEEEFQ
ncbi:MAG: sugar ABC transporter permease [Clostridiales bacterium]|nr:sugar ABC transporter permease [Clostridiales bacterium]